MWRCIHPLYLSVGAVEVPVFTVSRTTTGVFAHFCPKTDSGGPCFDQFGDLHFKFGVWLFRLVERQSKKCHFLPLFWTDGGYHAVGPLSSSQMVESSGWWRVLDGIFCTNSTFRNSTLIVLCLLSYNLNLAGESHFYDLGWFVCCGVFARGIYNIVNSVDDFLGDLFKECRGLVARDVCGG